VPFLVKVTPAGIHNFGAFASRAFATRAAHGPEPFTRFPTLGPNAIDGLAPGLAGGFEQHAELGEAVHDLGTPGSVQTPD
jgi:hypothetical protein